MPPWSHLDSDSTHLGPSSPNKISSSLVLMYFGKVGPMLLDKMLFSVNTEHATPENTDHAAPENTEHPAPENTGHSPNDVSMLAHRLRRWSNIEAALGECPVVFVWGLLPALKGHQSTCWSKADPSSTMPAQYFCSMGLLPFLSSNYVWHMCFQGLEYRDNSIHPPPEHNTISTGLMMRQRLWKY